MSTIAFFNNKGGVGTTSLVYHLAWMYADLGLNVIAADLDPQAKLTGMCIDDDRLEELWSDTGPRRTVYGAIQPLLEGTEDVASPHLEEVTPGVSLVVGDLRLSAAEDELSSQWADCLDRKPRAFRVVSALWRVIRLAAHETEADLVLIDVGHNLGALNRTALLAGESVALPLALDSSSVEGLHNLGPTLRRWGDEWTERRKRNPVVDLEMPEGVMRPVGYLVMEHVVRLDRPVQAYRRWMHRIPDAYREAVLGQGSETGVVIDDDPHCLATLKQFRSLMPLAQEAHKPMFFLKAADGAIGGHAQAVQDCYREFRALAIQVGAAAGIAAPEMT